MISVQGGLNYVYFYLFILYKQWFTEQVALYLNTFDYSLHFLKLMLKTIGSTFTLYGYN